MVKKYNVARIQNNKVVETNVLEVEDSLINNYLTEFSYVLLNIIEPPTLLEFQFLDEEKKYRKNKNDEWEEYQDVIDTPFDEAKEQKDAELSSSFRNDIDWTDEENQFYQKWKGLNTSDTSYDEWYGKVVTYWNEAYTEKQANNVSLSKAKTLADLRKIQYSPQHKNTKESLQTPYQTT